MMWPAAERWRAPVDDFPPRWATAWGDDPFGLWADLAVGSAAQRLRWIEPSGPAGFWMGSPREERAALEDEQVREGADSTEHEPRGVTVPEGFWLAEGPCTQALWEAVMGGNPSQYKDAPDAPQRPVEQVSFDDVQEFLRHLRGWLPEGCEPALPTEAQWEYAARAGTTTAYPWGDEPDDARANWNIQHDATTPVGRFEPNHWGLLDMHGNVLEWCADPWHQRLDGAASAAMEGPPRRAVRGGSWLSPPGGARSADRLGGPPGGRTRFLGFRLALRSSSPAQAR